MDTERPHRSTSSSNSSSTSELFVCFTSRLSSSSMKLSSKSLLSPSRSSRDPPQISLSSSLSRRLRSNGSMKGGQASPMFPTVGKRRGCGFENPEPSSPKVTCIGQVRVKTKKQGKKMRARSKRRSEASFRKTTDGGLNSSDLTRQNSSSAFQYQNNHQNLQQECLKHRNQRWVHLPLTICEALREFNCFFPCRSSCMREKGEKGGAFGEEGSNGGGHGHHHHGREGSCGAAFARWLHVALQEGGDGKGREIEVVMREDEVEVENDDGDDGRQRINAGRSYRRHVFEDIDIDEVEGKKENEGEGGEAEKARVSICVPPKNALLLMRCRSDPVKMAALANRFWESPVHKDQHGVNVEDDEEDEGHGDDDGVEEHQEEEAEEEQNEVEMEEDEGVRRNTEEARNSICEREREGSVESEEQHHHVVPFTEEAEQAEEEPEVMESFEIESRTNPDSSEVHEANQAKEEQEQEQEKDEDEEGNASHQQDEDFSCASNLETHSDLENPETTLEAHLEQENFNNQEEDKNEESSELSSTPETLNASEPQNDEAEAPQPQPEQQSKTTTIAETETSTQEEEEESSTEEQQQQKQQESSTEEQQQQKQQNVTTDTPPPPPPPEVTPPTQEEPDPNNEPGSEERENGSNGDQRERERDKETLPECLLLMMCEPKLSMEVSKETWVCSTDFIRWLPERQAGKAGGCGRKVSAVEGKNGVEKKASPVAAAPPRSSCSFPAAAGVSMAAMIEQRLAAGTKSNGYEPFVLTRCKSEPMRSTAKLAADACFWKKPHAPPTTLGVGAPAGVGF